MFEKGKLMPDIALQNESGDKCRLWDFRNRNHVALFVGPESDGTDYLADAKAHAKTWDWLGVKCLRAEPGQPALQTGVYAVDRFGGLIAHVPYSNEIWKKLEEEFLYYEAKHC